MAYYLVQPRRLTGKTGTALSFPSSLTLELSFGPADAFGVAGLPANLRTTTERAKAGGMVWNANEGTASWEVELIGALQTEFQGKEFFFKWVGDKLTFKASVGSWLEAQQIIGSANALVPAFLSLRLRVFVWIKEFVAFLGNRSLRCEVAALRTGITIATKEHNEQQASSGVRDWKELRGDAARMIPALYYYRHAMRLARIDSTAMTAEIVLNLAKAIEIIFSSDRGRLRATARAWGLDQEFLERWIIPILLIRNEFNVAHAASAPLTQAQLEAVLTFVARAFVHVHSLLSTVLDKVQSGTVKLEPISSTIDASKEKLLARISDYATAP